MEETEFIYWATKAIREIDPNAEFVLRGNDLANIEWHKITTPTPTIAEIETKIELVKENFAAEQNLIVALKASAKAKLIAGEPLTAAEADTLVI